jgi:hypothetical protein
VDIEQATAVVLNETGTQDAHESRQHHQIRLIEIDLLGQCTIKTDTVGEIAMLYGSDWDSCQLSGAQSGCVGTITDDRRDPSGPLVGGCSTDNGLHVAAATRNQDHDIFHVADCSSEDLRSNTDQVC